MTSPSLPTPPPRPTPWNALQSFDLSENLQARFARVPAQRKALLFGIAGGTCIGGLRFLSTRRGWASLNWGVYSFVFLSSVSYYELSKKRQAEVEQIQQVVTKMNQVKPSPKLTANLAAEGERHKLNQKDPVDSNTSKKWWPW